MCEVFIDTNIFLGFYQENTGKLDKLFENISKLKPSIILIDQVLDEFLRNRDNVLGRQIELAKKNVCSINTSPLVKSLDEYLELEAAFKNFIEKNKLLIQKLEEIKENLSEDIVYLKFHELYTDPAIMKYQRTDEIISKAYKRMLIGNPPVDYDNKNTIGDQIIWEILISNMEKDLI